MKHWKPVLLATAVALSTAAPAAAAQSGNAAPATPDCAWQPLGYLTSNIAYPDTNSQYWTLSYTVQKDLGIQLDGRYPDARYASFATYDSARSSFTGPDGKVSSLPDYLIDPDRGSRNPYQQKTRAGGKYTVTVSAGTRSRSNTLPIAPAGTAEGTQGTLIYRLYLNNGKVRLPDVTFLKGGHRVHVAACANALTTSSAGTTSTAPGTRQAVANTSAATTTTASGPAAAPDATTAVTPTAPAFARAAGTGLYPNPDNAYLSAGFDAPPAGQVLVVRGKAPSATAGSHAQPWPARKTQARYWSLCDNLWFGPGEVVANTLPDGTVDPGCRADYDTDLADDGTYTYVIGTEEQRAAVEAIPGVTFVPLSSATPTAKHVLILRNMLVSSAFKEAIQRVPAGSDAAATAAVMGAYYPRTAYCDLTALTASGPDVCPVA